MLKISWFGELPRRTQQLTQFDIDEGIEYLNEASSKINEVLSEIGSAVDNLPGDVFSYGDFKYPLEEIQGQLAVAADKAREIKPNYPEQLSDEKMERGW